MEIRAIDSVQPNQVVVAATNKSSRTCVWGELLSTATRARGGRGAVIDGHTRDVRLIERMGFPVFSTGMRPVDSRGRGMIVSYGEPVACGGVLVHEGDIVFADVDVVVIPHGGRIRGDPAGAGESGWGERDAGVAGRRQDAPGSLRPLRDFVGRGDGQS